MKTRHNSYGEPMTTNDTATTWAKTLRRELDAVSEATDAQVTDAGEPRGVVAGPVAATMEAVLTSICEGMPLMARHWIWAQDPNNRHLRDGQYRVWEPTVKAIADVAAVGGPTAGDSPEAWMSWCRTVTTRFMEPGDKAAPQGFKTRPNAIVTPHGLVRTVPPEAVEDMLRVALAQAINGATATARANMMEYAITRIHPMRDGNGRLSRLAGNLLSLGRNIPAELQHHEYCDGLHRIRESGDAKAWVALRHEQLTESGRMPTSSLESALDWARDTRRTLDIGYGNPEAGELYQHWMLDTLRARAVPAETQL